MLVIPCSTSSSSGSARKVIGDVEGIMPEHLERARPDLRGGGAGSGRGRSRSPRRRGGGDEVPSGLCHNWNSRTGACGARDNRCRIGFVHGVCNVCGKPGHRSIDVHGDSYAKGKEKGKNKDKGKGKNKNKNKKGDQEVEKR